MVCNKASVPCYKLLQFYSCWNGWWPTHAVSICNHLWHERLPTAGAWTVWNASPWQSSTCSASQIVWQTYVNGYLPNNLSCSTQWQCLHICFTILMTSADLWPPSTRETFEHLPQSQMSLYVWTWVQTSLFRFMLKQKLMPSRFDINAVSNRKNLPD